MPIENKPRPSNSIITVTFRAAHTCRPHPPIRLPFSPTGEPNLIHLEMTTFSYVLSL